MDFEIKIDVEHILEVAAAYGLRQFCEMGLLSDSFDLAERGAQLFADLAIQHVLEMRISESTSEHTDGTFRTVVHKAAENQILDKNQRKQAIKLNDDINGAKHGVLGVLGSPTMAWLRTTSRSRTPTPPRSAARGESTRSNRSLPRAELHPHVTKAAGSMDLQSFATRLCSVEDARLQGLRLQRFQASFDSTEHCLNYYDTKTFQLQRENPEVRVLKELVLAMEEDAKAASRRMSLLKDEIQSKHREYQRASSSFLEENLMFRRLVPSPWAVALDEEALPYFYHPNTRVAVRELQEVRAHESSAGTSPA